MKAATAPLVSFAPVSLAGFEPVSLDELNAEAELLTRLDRKYLIPAQAASEMLSQLRGVRVLEMHGRREFAYDSVYFDTPDRLSYRLTAQRRRRRFKLRTRSYLDSGATFLEVKTKSGRGSTVKRRIPYEPAARARLIDAGSRFAAELLTAEGHDPDLIAQLSPSLVSTYRRSTLLLPDGSRATLDTQLRFANPRALTDTPSGGDIRELRLDDYVIVESKSTGQPSALDRELWRAGHRPSGISKFGTGTAAIHPDLPSNKWARALAGPFRTADLTY